MFDVCCCCVKVLDLGMVPVDSNLLLKFVAIDITTSVLCKGCCLQVCGLILVLWEPATNATGPGCGAFGCGKLRF